MKAEVRDHGDYDPYSPPRDPPSRSLRSNPRRNPVTGATGAPVPFVNGPFESEIHGTVKFTQFCCVLLVTWCYRVLLSCYLRPK